MVIFRVPLVLAVFLSTVVNFTLSADTDPKFYDLEKELFDQLTANYSSLFRPAKQTTINFSISLASIVEVNEKNGFVTTTFIPKMSWHDPRLIWNMSGKFASITHLQIPNTKIWIPDLEVLNRHVTKYQDTMHDSAMEPLVWVHSDGTVYFVPRRTYQTPCSFDMDEFPYDTQTCQVVMGSWAYLKNEVDFVKIDNGTDELFYVGHSEFGLLNLTLDRLDTVYGENGGTPFVELVVNITLGRKTQYFYYMYMLPADMFLFMLPVVHLLPANRDSKIFILGSLLICTIMMMNTLNDFMPGYYSDRAPKPLRLYFACIVSIFVSSVVTCITYSISSVETKNRRVPLFLQKVLINGLGRLCCFCPEADKLDYQLLNLERSLEESTSDEDGSTSVPNDTELLAQNDTEAAKQAANARSESNSSVVNSLQLLVSELQLARYRDKIRMEWLQLAQVIDMFFFIVFIISALCYTRLNHYHYYHSSSYSVYNNAHL